MAKIKRITVYIYIYILVLDRIHIRWFDVLLVHVAVCSTWEGKPSISLSLVDICWHPSHQKARDVLPQGVSIQACAGERDGDWRIAFEDHYPTRAVEHGRIQNKTWYVDDHGPSYTTMVPLLDYRWFARTWVFDSHGLPYSTIGHPPTDPRDSMYIEKRPKTWTIKTSLMVSNENSRFRHGVSWNCDPHWNFPCEKGGVKPHINRL